MAEKLAKYMTQFAKYMTQAFNPDNTVFNPVYEFQDLDSLLHSTVSNHTTLSANKNGKLQDQVSQLQDAISKHMALFDNRPSPPSWLSMPT